MSSATGWPRRDLGLSWTSETSSSGRSGAIMTPSRRSPATAVARLDAAARLILRDPELARDAVQDGFIRAWRNLPALRDPDRFDAWLRRLVVHSCIDIMRRRRHRAIEVELTPIDGPAVGDIASAIADRDLARRGAPAPRPGMARRRRHALLPRHAAARGGEHARHPARDGQVPPPSIAPGDAHLDRGGRELATRHRPRRAARMMPNDRFDRQLPALLDEHRAAADARLLRRPPRADRPHAPAARLDLPRKVAPDG